MEIPEGEEKEKGTEHLIKAIIAENFPNLGREMAIQIHEAQRTPHKLKLKRAKFKNFYNLIVKSQRQKEVFFKQK